MVAFGSTRRVGVAVEDDANLQALASCGISTVAIFGKTSVDQVGQVLQTTLDENLKMISDSITYLKERGLTVFFDAEHFFDGFKADQNYSLLCLRNGGKAGADYLVLCDTNGGTLPGEVAETLESIKKRVQAPLAIHAHNDSELAVANTLAAVKAGATQVQGAINGYGERCGNANLCSIIPNLKLKMGIDCITNEQLPI